MAGAAGRFVAYERVSTRRQGASGLGLEAQRKTIDDFAASRGAEVIGRFTEVESGKVADRPELARALHLAKVTGATLLIAKLDRLSRNAAFLLALRDSGVKFVAADLPEANDLTVGIMALVAEQEREAISRRTKEALAAAKARGVRLGNPNGGRRAEAGRPGRCAAQGSRCAERGPPCTGPAGRGRGHPAGRAPEPRRHRRRTQRPRHPHTARRPMAQVHGDEPAQAPRATALLDDATRRQGFEVAPRGDGFTPHQGAAGGRRGVRGGVVGLRPRGGRRGVPIPHCLDVAWVAAIVPLAPRLAPRPRHRRF